jgi:peptidoglycan/xylan/chitin deacetylase (PgdA/CDA1 family)
VLVLCYHAVSSSWPDPLAVTPEDLERQLRWVRAHGYRGAPFSEAVSEPQYERTVAVTFDDAYLSVRDLALPILDRLGLPGTVFAPTAFIGSDQPMAWPGIDHWLGTPHEHELRPMAWEDLAALVDSGWEVGAHTRTHPHLPELPDDELYAELEGSRRDCEERLGRPCAAIAYPYGDVDLRVIAAAGRAGYSAAAALPRRFHFPRPLEWPRVGVYGGQPWITFRLKVAPVVRRVRSSPRLAGLLDRGPDPP